MNLEILPRIGVNSIRFGYGRGEVRKSLVPTLCTYTSGTRGGDTYDFFSTQGVFVYYDSAGNLEAIEAARPASAMFSSIDLLSLGLDEAIIMLSSLGEEVNSEVDGATSLSCGIALFAPFAKEDRNAAVESVLIFRDGYYD